ncbi:hypothetical protein D6D20_01457 [Aureobasidium pullulans]|uniref:Uncharacterized protein n=1 Tax=Aureobasidium pullulans TaxID=5580 RepID=A0A4S9YEB2_AURPU|nr:hypothetical protein D6D20_01457 [Aureobasidium pullulans]THZ91688.1 hypothetical protein D6C82_09846 [Aureobasidium pullulans]
MLDNLALSVSLYKAHKLCSFSVPPSSANSPNIGPTRTKIAAASRHSSAVHTSRGRASPTTRRPWKSRSLLSRHVEPHSLFATGLAATHTPHPLNSKGLLSKLVHRCCRHRLLPVNAHAASQFQQLDRRGWFVRCLLLCSKVLQSTFHVLGCRKFGVLAGATGVGRGGLQLRGSFES